MRKLLLVCLSILLSVYTFLTLLSLRSDYFAQRELWGINRKLFFIASHQESIPDFAINQLADRYRAFSRKYDGSKDKELLAEAQLAIAKTYELRGRWDEASAVYKGVIKNYPLTESGFSVPLYLAVQRVVPGDQKVYTDDDALAFYQKIAASNPKSKLEYNALKMIALCQLNQKDWSGSVNTMGEIMLKYPLVKAIQQSVYGINVLCVTKLHDYDKGINIYSRFIKRYPGHSADPFLKTMIKDFQLLKNKSLIIQSSPMPTIKLKNQFY